MKKKLFTYVLILFIILNVIFLIINLIFTFPPFLIIQTNSMYPLIKPGDLVLVNKISNFSNLSGSVIAFINFESGKIYVHRIIKVIKVKNLTLYETKGDNNLFPDKILITKNQILGIIKFVNFKSFKKS